MPKACVILRDTPHYRHDAFRLGLAEVGWQVSAAPVDIPTSEDVLLMWNRHPTHDGLAKRYEAVGATVIIAENGWIGADPNGHHLYSICRSHHNGRGKWSVGAGDRWGSFGVALKPWRTTGDDILVLPQRGIGELGVAMPAGWPERVVRNLRGLSKRRVRIRLHPGKEPRPPLDPDLVNCHAAVTWASGAAIKAIAAGIPVFYELADWIGAPAAKMGVDEIERPFLGDRLPMFRRLAWAQWSVTEIEAGLPFRQWWRG